MILIASLSSAHIAKANCAESRQRNHLDIVKAWQGMPTSEAWAQEKWRANADKWRYRHPKSLPHKTAHNVITSYVKLLFFVESGIKKTALKGLSFA